MTVVDRSTSPPDNNDDKNKNKYFMVGDKKVTLEPIEDVMVLKYKNTLDDASARFMFSSKPETKIEGAGIKTYPKYNIALVSIPPLEPAERASVKFNFSRAMTKDNNVEFVSKAYREKETGKMIIPRDDINIKFKKGTSQDRIEKLLSANDLEVLEDDESDIGLYLVKKVKNVNGDTIIDISNKLSSEPEVEFAEPNFITEIKKESHLTTGEYFEQEWHLNNTAQQGGTQGEDVDALEAWEISNGGSSSVVICCMDDGTDIKHPSLKDNIWENPDQNAPDRNGRNFYDDENINRKYDPRPFYFAPPYDEMRGNDIHGTPCSGVIAAYNEEKGVCGIAYGCKILPVKIWGADDLASNNKIARAIRYGGKYADIISCSWSSAPSNIVTFAIRDVVKNGRNGRGCSIFVATGNNAPSPISFPARAVDAIAVGASTNEGTRAYYSQYGPEIDFLAPSSGGTLGIFTTDVSIKTRGFNIGKPEQGDKDGYYTNSFGGTSSATPLAAGIAGLMLSVNPDLTAEQVRQILRNSCDKIDSNIAKYKANGFSLTHGYGRVNAKRALEIAKESN